MRVALPPPRTDGPVSLERSLRQRRSVRTFAPDTLGMAEIGQLLWAAQGTTGSSVERTAPSAGALDPLEIYAVTPSGVSHYEPATHSLLRIAQGNLRADLYVATHDQECVRDAPLVIVVAAVYERTSVKYGKERGARYVLLEAGHVAQNVLLQAVSLGLGAVPVGAFDDRRVQTILRLPADHQPVYLVPVGRVR